VARLDWSKSAVELDRWIRGCDPNPGAHAQWRGQTVRLFGGRVAAREESGVPPGTVLAVAPDALRVAARGGVLEVAKLRVGSGGKVAAGAAGIAVGERLG
jgi:methionyl-tRNA formyltransferase